MGAAAFPLGAQPASSRMANLSLAELLPDYADFGPIPNKPDTLSGVYIGNDTVLTRLWSGHLVIAYTGDMIVMPHLVNIGVNEPHITRTLVSLIRPGDVFVDVGANVGYYTILGGWRSYPGGQVWAFEPNPHIYAILGSNITNNGLAHSTERRQLALSSRAGSAPMRIFKGYEATSTIRELSEDFISHTRRETGQDSYLVEVGTDTLDAQMAAVPKIDVMKIDVEGHEPAMLAGAAGILARSPGVKIVMEFNPPIMGAERTRELLQLVRALGFSIYRIEHDATFTRQDDDARLTALDFADLLLLKQ